MRMELARIEQFKAIADGTNNTIYFAKDDNLGSGFLVDFVEKMKRTPSSDALEKNINDYSKKMDIFMDKKDMPAWTNDAEAALRSPLSGKLGDTIVDKLSTATCLI